MYLNNVKVDSSIWLYSVHSNNSELIRHHIEGNGIKPSDDSYEIIFQEGIKCHHNEISNYIENNLLSIKDEDKNLFDERISCLIFQCYNYSFFPTNFEQSFTFFNICQYNYKEIVNCLINAKENFEIDNEIDAIHNASDKNETDMIYYLMLREKEINENYFQKNKNNINSTINKNN